MIEKTPKKNVIVLTVLPIVILVVLGIAAYSLFEDILFNNTDFAGQVNKVEKDISFKMSSLTKETFDGNDDKTDSSETKEKISKLGNKKKGVVKIVCKIFVLTDQGEKYNIFINAKNAPDIIEGDWLIKKGKRCLVYDEKPRSKSTRKKFEIYPIKITSEK